MVKVEKILSTIENESKDLDNAPFWKNCYHKDEVSEEMLNNGKQWYEYHVKFNDLKPIMITKQAKLKKIKKIIS